MVQGSYELKEATDFPQTDIAQGEDYEEEGDEYNVGYYKDDENKERGNWNNHVEFVLSIIGYCVGIGNVWRFPYLAYKNGGGAFLIPYWTIALCIGLPLFMLEVSIGQFSSSGPTTCWRFAPLFSGCGYASFVLITLVSLFYNTLVSWCLFYFFASFTGEVPWKFCGHERDWVTWTNYKCNLNASFVCENTAELELSGITYESMDNGTCYSYNTSVASGAGKLEGIYNRTLALSYGIKSELPSSQYFYYYLIGENSDTSFTNIGGLRWQNVGCIFLAWLIVYVCLINGIKSAGKVVYFTAVFPYVGLITLLVRGVTLDGGVDGIRAYITPQWDKIVLPQVWVDAAVQLFFSLGPGWGNLGALASYNKFHNNTVLDSLIAVFADSGTSMLAGFTIFSYLGYFAKVQGVPIFEVADSGPSLAFIIYPYALTFLPFAPAWSVLFFFTLLLIALDSSFNIVEGILTGVLDKYPVYRKSFKAKAGLFAGICIFMFIGSLPMATNGGVFVVNFFVAWTAGWPLLTIALCECIAVAYVYGFRRFARDIGVMIPFFNNKVLTYCYGALLLVISPIVVIGIIISDWINLTTLTLTERAYTFPKWAITIGLIMQVCQVFPILAMAVYQMFIAEGSFLTRLRIATTPTYDWGPALVKHRKLIDHVPGFIVNPKKWKAEQDAAKAGST